MNLTATIKFKDYVALTLPEKTAGMFHLQNKGN